MFLQKIRNYINEKGMIASGEQVLAGVSGGADSVCLLLVLAELRASMEFELAAVHVEHGIRGAESREDADFVVELCASLGIPVLVKSVDVPAYAKSRGVGLEEAARELRYSAFEEAAGELRYSAFEEAAGELRDCVTEEPSREQWEAAREEPERGPGTHTSVRIALAHHMEDNAETVLYHLIRGSGAGGLLGMPPVREMPVLVPEVTERGDAAPRASGLSCIRPLLCVSREEIEAYLSSRGQEYRQDSTNSDLRYARNRLRNRVFPELEEINPQTVLHINESAWRLGTMWNYLQSQTDAAEAEAFTREEHRLAVEISKLQGVHPALREQLLLRAVRQAAGRSRDISAVHIRILIELIEGQSGRRVNLPCGIVAEKEFNRLNLYRAGTVTLGGGSLGCEHHAVSREQLEEIRQSGEEETVILPGGGSISLKIETLSEDFRKIEKKRYTKWFDYDKIEKAIEIRHRRPGDYLFIAGGHRKKLKQLMIEEKIPAGQREQKWLLAEGSCVVWLVGSRIGENYKLSERTSRVLVVSYLP